MPCESVITLCNGGEDCPICVAQAAAAPDNVCDPSGGSVPSNETAACEPFTLKMCIGDDCVAAADQADLTLHRVRATGSEAPYTATTGTLADEMEWPIPEDSLIPGWYHASLLLSNAGSPVLLIRYTTKFRVVACEETPDALVCLSGNEPAVVDPDATSFDCCNPCP